MEQGAENYRRYLAGEDDGIVEIVRDYKDGLILFLNRYVQDIHTAEDLAEDVFFRLVTKQPRFRADHSFKTWLYTIGRNAALNHLKRAGKMADTPVEELGQLFDEEEALERAYLREEQKLTVHRVLDRLRPDYSQVLYLKFFEDLTNEQTAKVMRKSKRQIENLTYQAKQALKTKLEQEGFAYEELY